jgi:hypothetical protein
MWRSFQRARRSLRTLPEDLARQAGLEELQEEIAKGAEVDLNPDPDGLEAWMRTPSEDEIKTPTDQEAVPESNEETENEEES